MISSVDAFSKIDKLIQERVEVHQSPGMAVVVTDAHETIWESYYGLANLENQTPVEAQTMFEIGSIGKSFTALTLLNLVERGQLDLHKAVTSSLPWLKLPDNYGPITAHHLLTHSAGLTVGVDFTPCARYEVLSLSDNPTPYPLGKHYHYSNAAYKLLGFLAEDVAGRPYGDLLQEWIFDPLNMDQSHALTTHASREPMAVGYERYYDDRPWHKSHRLMPAPWFEYGGADGSPACTAVDLARYLRMLLNGGEAPGSRIISPASFEQMLGRHVETGTGHYGYGLHVRTVDGRRVFGHNGGTIGYRATMLADLDQGLGVIIFVNGPAEADKDPIADYILRLLYAVRQGGPTPDTPTLLDVMSIDMAADYAGSYENETGSLRFSNEGHQLHLNYAGQQIALEQRSADRFYVNHPDFQFHLLGFERRDGEIVAACYGPDRYLRSGILEAEPGRNLPKEWLAYPGHYRSHNPWFTNFRVFARNGRLYIWFKNYQTDFEMELIEEKPGQFRLGLSELTPERIHFDTVIDGRAERAHVFGGSHYRFFTP